MVDVSRRRTRYPTAALDPCADTTGEAPSELELSAVERLARPSTWGGVERPPGEWLALVDVGGYYDAAAWHFSHN